MNTRLKSHNDTTRHDQLAKNVELMQSGKVTFDNPVSLLIASGYTQRSAEVIISRDKKATIEKGEPQGVISVLNDIWPVDEVLSDLKSISEAAKGAEQYTAALKAIDMVFKLRGDYAAQKIEHSGTIDHEVTVGTVDYLNYKQKELENKQYIDGEIIRNE